MERVKDRFVSFKQEEENLLLFGKQEEVADYQRQGIDFTVVITQKEEFDMLKDLEFLKFLSTLDIK